VDEAPEAVDKSFLAIPPKSCPQVVRLLPDGLYVSWMYQKNNTNQWFDGVFPDFRRHHHHQALDLFNSFVLV
jgi:hypothetical protein